ncbi:hypothetical protein HNR07_000614 [Nocardiopsis metallicus]|uniref:Uncharacterized protein n=1 Tax=Nocardiopsis metallicus TaxID=179819 RepID=A0A840WCK5_9ACTN|nr:hypothetical protein [Nocardiopsis metallicus]
MWAEENNILLLPAHAGMDRSARLPLSTPFAFPRAR